MNHLRFMKSRFFCRDARRRKRSRRAQNRSPRIELLEDRQLLAAIQAIQDGNWSDAVTWEGGVVPGLVDDVLIHNQIIVTYDLPEDGDAGAEAKSITVRDGGVLTFSRSQSTRLDLDGSLMILENGTLDVGNVSSPIPATITATIGFNVPDDRLFKGNTEPGPIPEMPDFHPDDIGLWTMMAGATSTFYGAPKNFLWTKLAQSAAIGATSLTLDQAPQGWRVGDQIILTPTQEDPDEVERRIITAIDGNTLTIDQPLDYFHEAQLYAHNTLTKTTRTIDSAAELLADEVLVPIQAEVGLLTQNVTVQSNLVSEGDPNHRAHTLYMMGGSGSISYTEFRDLGPRAKLGRYPVHFHKLGDAVSGFEVKGATVWGSVTDPGNKFVVVHETTGVTVQATVGFNAQGRGFYMEAGNETANSILNNLGVRVHAAEEIPNLALDPLGVQTLDGSGVFWLREGNTIRGNVAAGGLPAVAGFWITPNVATTVPATVFDGNETHSNSVGIYFTGENKLLSAITDTLIWRNDIGLFQGEKVQSETRDSLLFGNGLLANGDVGDLSSNVIVEDLFRNPKIILTTADNPLWVNDPSYSLDYTFTDGLLVMDKSQPFTLSEGINVLSVSETSSLGKTVSRTWTVELDTEAPTITINSGRNPTVTNNSSYLLKYTVHDEGKELFKHEIFDLNVGANVLFVTGTDFSGNTTAASYNVTYDPSYIDNTPEDVSNVTFTDGSVASSSITTGQYYVTPTVDAYPGSIRPKLRVVSGQVSVKIDPSLLGNTSTAEITGLQFLLNRDPIGPAITDISSGPFEYVWDSTTVEDGTYALSVRFVSGNDLHGFKSGVVWLAVDNQLGAVQGEQLVPVAFHRDPTYNGVVPGIDLVEYSDSPVERSGSPYSYEYAPPAHTTATPEDYRDPGIWFLEEITHAVTGNDGQTAVFSSSVDGHVFNDVFYTDPTGSSEGSVIRDRRLDYVDGNRNSAETSAFSTFVPNPEGTGWIGVDISGRIFRVDLDGTVTTIAGRKVKNDVLQYSAEIGPNLDQFESYQIEYVGDFENDLYFNVPNDLYFDLHDPKILYVADTYNHRIAKVDFHGDTPVITTLAGQPGVAGYQDGSSAEALFNEPYSIVVDWSDGSIYVADRGNQAIRKISPDGTVSTVVGNGPNRLTSAASHQEAWDRSTELIQDADFASANINFPQVIRMDSNRNLILGENTTHSVRRVNLETQRVEYLSDIPERFLTWIWLDVDFRGNVGPKDDYIVTASQTTRESGNFNTLVWRFDANGTKIGPFAGSSDSVTGHYPWAIAIDDEEARIVNTGFGGNGVRSVRADPDYIAPNYHFDSWKNGGKIFSRGTVSGDRGYDTGSDVPFTMDGRPSFDALFGNRGGGFSRLGNMPLFDDLAELSDEKLADYIQAGMGGSVPRPEITGYDLDLLIYYIRYTSLNGTFETAPIPQLPTDIQPPVIRNIRAEQVGPNSVLVTWQTDEPTIGLIRHGLLPGLYHEVSDYSDGFDDGKQQIIVDGVSPTQINYFKLRVKDIAGNIQEAGEFSFVLDEALAINRAPTSFEQFVSVLQDTPREVQLTASDVNGDPLVFTIGTFPTQGSLTNFDSNTGAVTYIPGPGYLGADAFTFTVSDGEFVSAETSVTISVVVDAPPVITSFTNDALDRDTDKAGLQIYHGDTITYAAVASDPEGNTLAYTWYFTKDSGAEIQTDQGVGTIGATVFSYPETAVGSTYSHILDVSDGLNTTRMSIDVEVISPLPPSLVGHWTFDDESGAVATDSTANGNHGTLVGDPIWAPGRVNSALEFDGVEDAVIVGDKQTFKFSDRDAFSVALWFKSNEAGGGQSGTLVSKRGSPTHWELIYNGYDYIVSFRGDFNSELSVSTPGTLQEIGVWRHIAFTYDGSSNAAGVNIYFDGVKQTLVVGNDNLAGTIDSTANLMIGGTSTDGAIDEVRIYNYEIDAATINLIKNLAPTAIDAKNVVTDQNSTVSIGPLADDLDSDNDPTNLIYNFVGPSEGLVAVNKTDGSFTFDPNGDFLDLDEGASRTASFTFTATDVYGAVSNPATVTITVNGINDVPTANDAMSVVTDQNSTVSIGPLADDLDNDNDATNLIYNFVGPSEGLIAVNKADGSFTFDPSGDFLDLDEGTSRTASFTFTATDIHSAVSNLATVTIAVNGKNDAPVANTDVGNTDEYSALTVDVLASDTDVDSADNPANFSVDTVSINSVTGLTGGGTGSVSIIGNQVRFDPGFDFDELDAIQTATVVIDYTMSDDSGVSSSSTLTILVSGFNDKPWQNPATPFDVGGDGIVDTLDGFELIDYVRAIGQHDVLPRTPPPRNGSDTGWLYVDVDGNNRIEILDIFKHIDFLRNVPTGEGESSGGTLAAEGELIDEKTLSDKTITVSSFDTMASASVLNQPVFFSNDTAVEDIPRDGANPIGAFPLVSAFPEDTLSAEGTKDLQSTASIEGTGFANSVLSQSDLFADFNNLDQLGDALVVDLIADGGELLLAETFDETLTPDLDDNLLELLALDRVDQSE